MFKSSTLFSFSILFLYLHSFSSFPFASFQFNFNLLSFSVFFLFYFRFLSPSISILFDPHFIHIFCSFHFVLHPLILHHSFYEMCDVFYQFSLLFLTYIVSFMFFFISIVLFFGRGRGGWCAIILFYWPFFLHRPQHHPPYLYSIFMAGYHNLPSAIENTGVVGVNPTNPENTCLSVPIFYAFVILSCYETQLQS